jgi:uncharacterized protein YjbJ (UPF0337 family)
MNKDIANGQWNQLKGQVRKQWGKLTDDDITQIKGDSQILIGKIQERYGRTREEVAVEVERWLDESSANPSNPRP